MIDLHSHTNQSDGSCSPEELIAEARRVGVHILAIADHDTFTGYNEVLPHARKHGVELMCGIELSTKLHGESPHLLGISCAIPICKAMARGSFGGGLWNCKSLPSVPRFWKSSHAFAARSS